MSSPDIGSATMEMARGGTDEVPQEVPPASGTRGGKRGGKRRRGRRIAVGIVASTAVLLGAAAAGVYFEARSLPGDIDRVSGSFDGLDEQQRPVKLARAMRSLTFLVVGTDSRAPRRATSMEDTDLVFNSSAKNSDALMLVQLSGDRKHATTISMPRDSWVSVPGKGKMKLRSAYAVGGAPLLVNTVEQLTGARIDHFAIIDFAGFKSIINTVGGVDLMMSQGTTIGNKRFRPGLNHLNGSQALTYVRETDSLPNGDLDRVRRHQDLVRAVMASTTAMNPARDPLKMYDVLKAGLRTLAVDDGLADDELRSLATSLIGLPGGNISFMTTPVGGLGREGKQNVVYLDEAKCGGLWTAIRDDSVFDYLALAK